MRVRRILDVLGDNIGRVRDLIAEPLRKPPPATLRDGASADRARDNDDFTEPEDTPRTSAFSATDRLSR